jgi:hypothetical protein
VNKTAGQIAYERYRLVTGGRSLVTGKRLPPWDDQTPEIQSAWNAAGTAAGEAYMSAHGG